VSRVAWIACVIGVMVGCREPSEDAPVSVPAPRSAHVSPKVDGYLVSVSPAIVEDPSAGAPTFRPVEGALPAGLAAGDWVTMTVDTRPVEGGSAWGTMTIVRSVERAVRPPGRAQTVVMHGDASGTWLSVRADGAVLLDGSRVLSLSPAELADLIARLEAAGAGQLRDGDRGSTDYVMLAVHGYHHAWTSAAQAPAITDIFHELRGRVSAATGS
jgi:hypothetical protein